MKKFLTYLLYIICLVLLVLEFFIDKSSVHFNIEKHFALFGVVGFLATFFYVLSANLLGKLILKDKDFYDKQ
ncbi:MAG: hypothetical protein ACOX3T_05520 [Bdellovibrionota bacterium]